MAAMYFSMGICTGLNNILVLIRHKKIFDVANLVRYQAKRQIRNLKQKIIYGFLVILLLGSFYFGLRFALGFFSPYNFWTTQKNTKKEDIQIVDTGDTSLHSKQKQPGSSDKINTTDIIIEKVVDLVAEQKIVKHRIQLIDSLSKNKRHISLIPILNDTAKNIYLVKVCEGNEINYVTYYNFLVDGNSMTIINSDGKLERQ